MSKKTVEKYTIEIKATDFVHSLVRQAIVALVYSWQTLYVENKKGMAGV